MEITIELPNDLTNRPDPARETLEAVAIAGYRSGKLTASEASRLLGFASRFEFEALLKQRGIREHAYSSDDLANDVKTIRQSDDSNPLRAGMVVVADSSPHTDRF